MEVSQESAHEIVFYRQRKQVVSFFLFPSIFLASLTFMMLHTMLVVYPRDPDPVNIIMPLVMTSVCLSYFLFVARFLYVLRRSKSPVLRINEEGFALGYQSIADILLERTLFVPWSEISRIACFHSQSLFLTITLKNPESWWSLYGNGHRRKFLPRRQFGGAQFAIMQYFISMSLPKLLQQIQENYAHEIRANEVEIGPFASQYDK